MLPDNLKQVLFFFFERQICHAQKESHFLEPSPGESYRPSLALKGQPEPLGKHHG